MYVSQKTVRAQCDSGQDAAKAVIEGPFSRTISTRGERLLEP